MSEFEVEVEGAKPPPAGPGRGRRILARVVAIIRAWLHSPPLLVLSALIGFVLIVGTPHVQTYAECRMKNRDGSCRYYGFCDYYGIQGKRVFSLEECADGVKFLPIEWGRLFGKI